MSVDSMTLWTAICIPVLKIDSKPPKTVHIIKSLWWPYRNQVIIYPKNPRKTDGTNWPSTIMILLNMKNTWKNICLDNLSCAITGMLPCNTQSKHNLKCNLLDSGNPAKKCNRLRQTLQGASQTNTRWRQISRQTSIWSLISSIITLSSEDTFIIIAFQVRAQSTTLWNLSRYLRKVWKLRWLSSLQRREHYTATANVLRTKPTDFSMQTMATHSISSSSAVFTWICGLTILNEPELHPRIPI